MFKGRKLLIATKHCKEQVIAPIFENKLGVHCYVTDKFDTDTLGTFSGEINRKEDALTTLRNKCLLAMEANDCDLAIASEGSFGMHPSIFFAQANDEMMLFLDTKNKVEVISREISADTNFNASKITNVVDLLAFAEKSNFPSHGLILKPSQNNFNPIYKGISEMDDLLKKFQVLLEQFGSVYVETDMRANFNPTRMKLIVKVALKLVESIQNECPNCNLPGFSITKVNAGLPCEWCNSPTQSTLSYVYECKKCNYQKEDLHPNNKTKENPMYCDFCNP
jgi:hypothetical protein